MLTSSLADHHPLGASTGVLGRGGDWAALVRAACEISTHAIELAALEADELPSLLRFLADRPRLPFRHLSVHAPVKGVEAVSDEERAAAVARLPLGVRSIVVHPDLIVDPAPWRALGRRIVVENMDDRKADGRTAAELAPLFAELPEAGFCLDIAHAHTIDPDDARRRGAARRLPRPPAPGPPLLDPRGIPHHPHARGRRPLRTAPRPLPRRALDPRSPGTRRAGPSPPASPCERSASRSPPSRGPRRASLNLAGRVRSSSSESRAERRCPLARTGARSRLRFAALATATRTRPSMPQFPALTHRYRAGTEHHSDIRSAA